MLLICGSACAEQTSFFGHFGRLWYLRESSCRDCIGFVVAWLGLEWERRAFTYAIHCVFDWPFLNDMSDSKGRLCLDSTTCTEQYIVTTSVK